MTLPTITAADLPRQAYAHGKQHDPALTQPEKFRPVINSTMFVKPEAGGLWTSPITDVDYTGEIISTEWTEWCHSENFDLKQCTNFLEIAPNRDACVLHINGRDDLLAIHDVYGLTGKYIAHWAVLDWERMVGDGWDAFYLTGRGEAETRFADPSLYGFDVATVLWLSPNYTVVTA
jgi:hypothetical protein